ncbi:MAG: cytochrome c oxidase subunit II [Planctomycetes bacterium]|nr:cytochrome c oxidase subunit II [Planctomycetota bacterium]
MFALLIQDPVNINGPDRSPQQAVDAYGQLTKLASTFSHVDGLFYFTYAVCIFFFVLIVGVLLFSVVKYRRKTWDQLPASNTTHNTPLEVVWTVIPLIIVMIMFAWGYMGARDMTVVPLEASRNTYKASAKQWNWTFHYPNHPVASYNEVWLEVGKPVQFLLESSDVLHAFYLPAMRVKRDVIPGRYQSVWFTPTTVGEYHLFCAEYCGKDHSKMYAKVHVVDTATFNAPQRPWDQWEDSTPELAAKSGANLYSQLCIACHSVNGTPGVGPSWKGLFIKNADGTYTGRQREVIDNTDGGKRKTITVDDAYIIESVHLPEAKKVAEEPYVRNAMTAFPDLDERKVRGLIEYMKTLADTK